MPDANIYRRPAFPARPWITGQLYDRYALPSVLHCDAYVFDYLGQEYLRVEWREGGRKLVASDAWLIEPDGLTPVWGDDCTRGRAVFWSRANHATLRGVHARVLALVSDMHQLGNWSRVVVQAHYVHVREQDCELRENAYKPPKSYAVRRNSMPDIL